MQLVSSRIWTRVVVSISYDDNQYTTCTSYEEYLPLLNMILMIVTDVQKGLCAKIVRIFMPHINTILKSNITYNNYLND